MSHECPECGYEKFSMLVDAVQMGRIRSYVDDGEKFFEGDETTIVDDSGFVKCANNDCMTEFRLEGDSFVPIEENGQSDESSRSVSKSGP